MRVWALAAASILVACSGSMAGSSGRAAARTSVAPAPTRVSVDDALGRAQDEGAVVLRLTVARQHPLGARLVPFVLAWPGWGATLSSLTHEPLTDLDWIAIVGPKDPARERLLTRTAAPDEAIDVRLQGRSDGSLRLVERVQPHLVAALPPDAAPVAQALRTARLLEPDDPDPDQLLRAEFLHPHGVLLYVPEETQRVVIRVDSRPGGAAEGFADLTFEDEATATRMAARLQARAEETNNLMVRLLTRDLLGGVSFAVEGPVVKVRVPATSDQLESLATLASAMLPPGSQSPTN
jgi:hypothetical protein